MNSTILRKRLVPAIVAATLFAIAPMTTTPASAQTATQAAAKTNHVATGSFTVKMTPASESGFGETGANLGRLSLDKVFEGGLAGVGKGEMLTALTMTKGSAGYVAIERFTGTLDGRTGSFVFQHAGSMHQGAQTLSIAVVPDSGAGDLIGLEGVFKIRIESGQHFYEFAYALPQLEK